MRRISPKRQQSARRLLESPPVGDPTPAAGPPQSLRRACEILRPGLTHVVGRQGFVALLSRAVALAKVEFVWLGAVEVSTEGTLAGVDEAAEGQGSEIVPQGCAAVFAHLLQLLAGFIGSELARKFVNVGWPGELLEEFGSEAEEGGA